MRIRTRNDLIKFIEDHPPGPAIARCIMHHNENLGRFDAGWVVKVTGKFKKSHFVLVWSDDRVVSSYRTMILLKEPDWTSYRGEEFISLLYRGDYPELYLERKENAKSKQK